MESMGQHHLYDVESHPYFSWEAKNVLPIVPMYHVNDRAGANVGDLNAIFINSPVCQS